jgi:hypothetical protein
LLWEFEFPAKKTWHFKDDYSGKYAGISEKLAKWNFLFFEKVDRKICSICPDFSFSTLVFMYKIMGSMFDREHMD